MQIFSRDSRSIEVWGPTAAVDVYIDGPGGIIGDAWLLVNFQIGAREIVDIRQCFNENSVLYALGNNQASCEISMTFAVFIGRRNCRGESNTAAIADGLEAYMIDRISNRIEPVPVTIGSFSRMAWITGIDMGNPDASKGICYGTIHMNMELKKR